MLVNIKSLLNYNLLHLIKHRNDFITGFSFFILAVILFHITIGPQNPDFKITIAIIINMLVFSMILSSDMIFKLDHREGFLELIISSHITLNRYILVKFLVFTLFSIVLTIFSILSGAYLFNLTISNTMSVGFAILTALPAQSAVICFTSALLVGYGGKLILSLLTMSLLIPIITLIPMAVNNQHNLLMLMGIDLIYVPLLLTFTAFLLKESML